MNASDQVTQGLNRLISQYSAKTRIRAYLASFLSQVQDVEDALLQVLSIIQDLGSQVGAQLDLIGRLVGQKRNGLSDADYLSWIRAKILVNRSAGRPDDVLRVLALTVPNVRTNLEFFPAAYLIKLAGALTIDPVPLAALLGQVRGVGINGQMLYSLADDTDTFTFADADVEQASTAQGWSDDPGPDWEATGTMTGGLPTCCYYGGPGLWLIGGTNGRLSTSPDGRTWTARTITGIAGHTVNAIFWSSQFGEFVLGADDVYTSPDGAVWTKRTSLSGVTVNAFFEELYNYCVCSDGNILQSTDGATWPILFGSAGNIQRFAQWAGSKIVGVGLSGHIVTSADGGNSWQTPYSSTSDDLLSVATDDATCFIAVGANNRLLRSVDMIAWTPIDLSSVIFDAGDINQVIWDDALELFVAVQSVGYTLYSSDGTTWYPGSEFDLGKNLYAVAADAAGLRIAGNFSGTSFMAESTDGVNWNGQTAPFTADVKTLAAGSGAFIAADTNGNFGISDDADGGPGGLWADVEQL